MRKNVDLQKCGENEPCLLLTTPALDRFSVTFSFLASDIGFFPLRHKGLALFFVLAAVFGRKEFPNELSSSADSRFQALLWFCPAARSR
jgi:hypothetical protein